MGFLSTVFVFFRVITLSNGLTALLISDTEVPGQHLLTTPPPLNLNAKEPRSGTDTEEEVAHSPAKKCKIRKKSSAQREKRVCTLYLLTTCRSTENIHFCN